MSGKEIVGLIVGALFILIFAGGCTGGMIYNSNVKHQREQTTLRECIEAGHSPVECKVAIQGSASTR